MQWLRKYTKPYLNPRDICLIKSYCWWTSIQWYRNTFIFFLLAIFYRCISKAVTKSRPFPLLVSPIPILVWGSHSFSLSRLLKMDHFHAPLKEQSAHFRSHHFPALIRNNRQIEHACCGIKIFQIFVRKWWIEILRLIHPLSIQIILPWSARKT